MVKKNSIFDFSDFYDEGFEKTEDLSKAIYVFQDGSLWSGYSEGGDGNVRDIDHGFIEAFFKDSSIDRYHPDFHSLKLEELIQIVPETRTVLTLIDNNYTDEQLYVLQQLEEENFNIERLESTLTKEVEQSVAEYDDIDEHDDIDEYEIEHEYKMEQPVSGMKAMNKLIENSYRYRQSLPEKDRPYIEEFSRNATISHELTFDDFDMEYTEYKVNGHPFYYKYAALDYDDEKTILSEALTEHLMKGNITISEIYSDDEIENLSPETQAYLRRSTGQSLESNEERNKPKTRADYQKEITERTQAAKELVLNQSKSADGLAEYGAFVARFAGKGSINVKLIYEQNAQAKQVVTKKEMETNSLSLASEQEQPLRIFEAKKIETFLTETNKYVPIYKATDEQKKLIANGTLKKAEKTYYNLTDAYDIHQLDKESQEKIRQEGTKTNVELEAVIHAYVEKQYASMKNGTFQKAFTEYIVRQHYGMDQVEEYRTKFDNWAKRESPEEYRLKTIDSSQKNAALIIRSINNELEGEKEVKQTIKKDRVTKQEIAAAEKVSILDIAQQNGIDLEQSSANEFRFVHDHSVVINTRKNIYNDFATSGRGGNTIHFVQKELNVKHFVQAVQYINSGEFNEVGDFTDKPVPYEYNPNKETQEFTASKNYLVNERKINPELVDHLHKEGLLRQSQFQSEAMKEKGYAPHHNLVMAWKYENQIVGATEQGVQKNDNYKRGAYKGIQKHSQTNRGFNFKFGEPRHLYCFESGIDAMSYASLQIKNGGKEAVKDSWYVSMEGLKSNALGEHIRLAYEALNKNKAPEEKTFIPTIELCIDNDEAADEFYKNLPYNKDAIVRNSPQLPEGKEKWDWNDQLKAEKENEIEVNSRGLENIKQPNPERTKEQNVQRKYAQQMAIKR